MVDINLNLKLEISHSEATIFPHYVLLFRRPVVLLVEHETTLHCCLRVETEILKDVRCFGTLGSSEC